MASPLVGAWRSAARQIGVLRIVLPPFVAGKLIGLLVPMLTIWVRNPGVGLPPGSALLQPFALWDGAAYTEIAQQGYPGGPLNLALGASGHLWAYLPGYPLLVHAASYLVPDTIAAGILVSAACELIALVFLAKLILQERDEGSARFACWALALFPYAVYLTTVYSESAFLAAATASLYYMRRGRDGRAAVAASLAMLVRITGVALVPALIVDHLIRRRGRPGRGLIAILASPVSLLLFFGYAWLRTGTPLAWEHAEQSASFNRNFAWPWDGARATFQSFTGGTGGNSFVFGMELLFGVAGLVAVVWMAWHWRMFAPSLTVFAAVAWLMGTSVVYWLSVPRYEMTVVPVYLVLADVTRSHPRARPVLLAVSAGWMGFLATLLATGQFVA
ncbi:MAG: glycosyltransferase family 39 protein [Candidatus Dormibacteria bacterium]